MGGAWCPLLPPWFTPLLLQPVVSEATYKFVSWHQCSGIAPSAPPRRLLPWRRLPVEVTAGRFFPCYRKWYCGASFPGRSLLFTCPLPCLGPSWRWDASLLRVGGFVVELGDTGAIGPLTAMTDGVNDIDWGLRVNSCSGIGSLIHVFLTLGLWILLQERLSRGRQTDKKMGTALVRHMPPGVCQTDRAGSRRNLVLETTRPL